MISRTTMYVPTVIGLCVLLGGCASTYGNMVSGSKLGAAEYQPAVYVPPEVQGKYEQVLAICRRVAVNRQITAAQKAQLETITGVTFGAASGAAMGLQFGSIISSAGHNVSYGEATAIGAAAGALASLGSAFASGTENDAAETRRILLNCLRSQQDAIGYTVVE